MSMEDQIAAILAQNKSIVDALKSVIPRLDKLELELQSGTRSLSHHAGGHSSASADTHVMVSDGEGSEARPEHRPPSSQRSFVQDTSPALSRYTRASHETTMMVLKDPGLKLVPPVVDCKDSQKIRPREFIDYLDNCSSFIKNWEAQPGNSGKAFDGAATFGLRNLKVPQQKQLAKLIRVIYDEETELRFVKKADLGNQVFWLQCTSQMAKDKLFAKLSIETSLQSCVLELQRIKFVSPFGLIDADAWDDYNKKILEALSFQSKNGYIVPDSVVKDVIISALPDIKFQTELFLLFGPIGSMYGHQELSDLIETIVARIQSVLGQNLQAVVNRAVSLRDSNSGKKFKANVVQIQEAYGYDTIDDEEDSAEMSQGTGEQEEQDEEQLQFQAFLAETAGKKQCDRSGTSPDGKLKCRFLGGTKASCIFTHPESDMKLKGKGFSIQSQQSSMRASVGSSRDA
jgi:hypothetical protein